MYLRFLARIYRLKILVFGLVLVLLGLLFSLLSDMLTDRHDGHIVVALIRALSDVLIVTGGIGLAVDFFTGRDREAADTARTRAVLEQLTPEFTDAVVRGFALRPQDLQRVATPELLDDLAQNALALRLGDRQFAEEIYADLRDQAIRVAERWYDVQVDVRLSATTSPAGGGSGNAAPLFDVLVQWEYTVTPTHPVQRFACVSDRDEFRELIADVPSTLPWLMTARPGMDASSRAAFELLEYRVDGVKRLIRRTARRGGQTYAAAIGEEAVRAGRPVRVSYLYRVITPRSGHRLYFEVTQPTRGLRVRLDYSDTDIAAISVVDLISSSHRTQVAQLPEEVDAKVLSVDLPSWLLPRAGFAFVWTLASELPAGVAEPADRSAPRSDAA